MNYSEIISSFISASIHHQKKISNSLPTSWQVKETQSEYNDRQRKNATKKAEWEERKRQSIIKKLEYDVRKKIKAINQADYEERQRQRAIKQAEYQNRQQQYATKQAACEERKRINDITQTATMERQRLIVTKRIEKEKIQRKSDIKQSDIAEQQRLVVIKRAKIEAQKTYLKNTQVSQVENNKSHGKSPNKILFSKKIELISGAQKTTPAFRAGDRSDIKTVILLSAPGQCEEKAGRPAAGETGNTLETMIKYFHLHDPVKFPSTKLADYTIVNATEEVYYMKKNNRTQGNDSEIKDPKNIQRINNVLANADNVIALGDNAQLAIDNSKFGGTVYSGEHPSMQALNKKYSSDKATPGERRLDRTSQWSKLVMESTKISK